MQTATILLNIGGDTAAQISKYNVTPSEVRVLQVIHGDDAVSDIAINTDEEKRTSRQERQRLTEIYSQRQPDGATRAPAVDMLFPGEAARLYETFDEAFDIEGDHAHMFRAVDSRPTKVAVKDPLDHDSDGKKGGSVPPTGEGYAAKTVAQLKALAEERGIDLDGATKKDDIIAKIEEADHQAQIDADVENDGIADMGGEDENLFQ